MSAHKYKIAVMIPTRGRTVPLMNSVKTLLEQASKPETLELWFAFDRDDTVGIEYWRSTVVKYLQETGVQHTALLFERQGYGNIQVYFNTMAQKTDADWLFIWCDDAVMETPNWDERITEHDGEFTLLKVHTHNEHPYSIFPIYPREWYDLFGFMSVHQMTDAELSQTAYMLDIMTIIDVTVNHDRFDLTGGIPDTTSKERVMHEGNPSDPRDLHHPAQIQHRMKMAHKIADYLRERGNDMTWWDNVLAGKQDPWEKMRANDINKQMMISVVQK